MNPSAILGAVVLAAATHGAIYYQGRQDGAASVVASQSKADDSAQKGAGNAVAQAKTQSVKVVTRVKTVTREVPVYRDSACAHDERVFDALNGALRGAGDGVVPTGSGSAPGPDDGRDHGQAD
jgi:hypothetical protein